ncbi:hypothetical protein GCM10027046_25310 [Uliginosibacterium flavum]
MRKKSIPRASPSSNPNDPKTMSDHNPYSPPAAVLSDVPASPSRLPRYVLAVLIILHLLLLVSTLPMLRRLMSSAAIPPLPHLLALLSDVLLLIGGALLLFSRGRGKIWLLLAGIGLLLATAMTWSEPIFMFLKWFYLAGAILGFAGWWIARQDAARMESAEVVEQS